MEVWKMILIFNLMIVGSMFIFMGVCFYFIFYQGSPGWQNLLHCQDSMKVFMAAFQGP